MDDVELLRERGLRVTAPRRAVLAAVARLPHATADTVLSAVRAELSGVSVQAVYDVLHALTDVGLLRRIEPAGHPSRYERRVGDNHHHVVCRRCGALDDVDCAVGDAPCLTPSSASGFTVDTAEVTYWGLCPACRATEQRTAETTDPGDAVGDPRTPHLEGTP
jgi:Fur family ferric uptake transcriptional regulator